MSYQYSKHYTRDEARALLPQIRKWLNELNVLRASVGKTEERLAQRLAQGYDLGGDTVNTWVKALCAVKHLLDEFGTREIQIKNVERGLIDFPSLKGDREVFLCWEQDEDDIEYWHELDTGYAGREKF